MILLAGLASHRTLGGGWGGGGGGCDVIASFFFHVGLLFDF